MVTMLSSGCMGFSFGIKGVDKSSKKTTIAGVVVDNTGATGVKIGKGALKADIKTDLKATGADLSKKISIGGDQSIVNQGVDMKTLIYIIGAFMALLTTIVTAVLADQKLLNGRLIKQLAKKDIIILDLANDQKEILLKILPMFILMKDREAFESFMKFKNESDGKIDTKIQQMKSKKGWFSKK